VPTLAALAAAGLGLAGCQRPLPPPQQVVPSNVVALRAVLGKSKAEAAAPAAAAASEPTGWATLKGHFRIAGEPPARKPLTVDKDVEVCAPGGRQVFSERLVVDSASGGIKDVVIYLTGPARFPVGDPKWEHPDYAATREATLEFDQKNCIFLTHVLAMRSQQKLKILNSDPVGHNTNIKGIGGAASINATIPVNAYAMYSPGGESSEPFDVSCSIHPWMSAWMIVRNNPYYAVSKPDGSFEIANLPAGVELEFRVWQEASKFLQEVQVNGQSARWNKGRFKLTLQPDETRELEVVVSAAVFQ
jgi:hypothetical protein